MAIIYHGFSFEKNDGSTSNNPIRGRSLPPRRQRPRVRTRNWGKGYWIFGRKHIGAASENKDRVSDQTRFNLDGPEGHSCYFHVLMREGIIPSHHQMVAASLFGPGIGFYGETDSVTTENSFRDRRWTRLLRITAKNLRCPHLTCGWSYSVGRKYSQIPLQRISRDQQNVLVVTKIRYNGIVLTLISMLGRPNRIRTGTRYNEFFVITVFAVTGFHCIWILA